MPLLSSLKKALRDRLEEKAPAQHDAEFEDSSAQQNAQSGLAWLKEIAAELPTLLGTALFSAAIVIAFLHFTPAVAPKVVAFDIIKYSNAQRAVASKLLGPQGAADIAPILLEVSKKTRATIQDVAGPNVLVVIRQAVVQGETRDITDEVLKRLGLPTDVPTADPTRRAIDIDPTMIGHDQVFYIDKAAAKADAKAEQSAGVP